MALPDSTTLYIESTLLYFTLLHSIITLFDSTSLYHTLSSLYFTLLHSTLALLGSTSLYYTLEWRYVRGWKRKVTKRAGGYSFGGRSRTVERPSVDGYSLASGLSAGN